MLVETALNQVLVEPTPPALRNLRDALLEDGAPMDDPVLIIIDTFYHFLNELVASSTAREFSHFASILDMAAVAGVAIENLIAETGAEGWWKKFMIGALSEVLMVLAARQYVKAWEEEMKASYHAAAWNLSQEYWLLSNHLQPDLAPQRRKLLIQELVSPVENDQLQGLVKAGLIVRLYQILLLIWLRHVDQASLTY